MPKDKLVREIRYELDQLQRVANVAAELASVPPPERRAWDAAAAAKYVTDLSLGLENLCKRRCRYLGIACPEGPQSHSLILKDFLDASDLGRTLPEELGHRLKKYLRFRHRFTHGYGYEVRWELVDEPLRLLPETVKMLCKLWEEWLRCIP